MWRIELPLETNRFSLDTVSDVVFSLRYTAKNGGDALRTEVSKQLFAKSPATPSAASILAGPGLRLFSARRELSAEWYRFLHQPADNSNQTFTFDLNEERFPFHVEGTKLTIDSVVVLFKLRSDIVYSQQDSLAASLTVASTESQQVSFVPNANGLERIIEAQFAVNGVPASPAWVLTLKTTPTALAGGAQKNRLEPSALEEAFVLCTYSLK